MQIGILLIGIALGYLMRYEREVKYRDMLIQALCDTLKAKHITFFGASNLMKIVERKITPIPYDVESQSTPNERSQLREKDSERYEEYRFSKS